MCWAGVYFNAALAEQAAPQARSSTHCAPTSTTPTCRCCRPAPLPWCSPAGTYSGVGARGACTVCPAGQYSPSEGLGDQTLVNSTIKCLACPAGSLALSTVTMTAANAASGDLTTGSTFCDAW